MEHKPIKILRKKISPEIEAEIMFLSDRKCCVCRESGDHIHHLDGNRSNSSIDNLVLLCFNDHNEASIIGGLRRKLSPKTIIKYRVHWYNTVANKRQEDLGIYSKTIKHLSEEDLLIASQTAIITIDIMKIKHRFFKIRDWKERTEILMEFLKYSDYSNLRIAYEIMVFAMQASYQTKYKMPPSAATELYDLVFRFFPRHIEEKDKNKITGLANLCADMAYGLIYDAARHLNNLAVATWGLNILKNLNTISKNHKIPEIEMKVKKVYSELHANLNRPSRKDLSNFISLIKCYENEPEELIGPLIPSPLYEIIVSEMENTG
jgi:hemerythrin